MHSKFTFLLFVMLVSANIINAQEDSLKIRGWVPSALAGVNITQLALSNWSQGGDDALSWTFYGNGGLNFFSSEWKFRNILKIAYGRTKLGGEEYRTNDNEIYFENVLSRNIGWALDPYVSNLIRTSVAAGFNYDSVPALKIVDFFDPGYVTQSIGFIYDKMPGFSSRLGFAVQETFTKNHTRYSDDTLTTEIEDFKLETGLESVTTAEYPLEEKLLLQSSLRLFTRFENMDVWDVRWDNTIAARITEYIDVKLSILMVYEKSQSLKTQLKEALQIGIFYTIY